MTHHSDRFTGKATEYSQYREPYDPEIVLPLLRDSCGLSSEWCVADVGAGTGMLGDLFWANENRVIAIEPNAEMRAVCASLHSQDAEFTVIEGTAEATGLPSASVEMVAAGRALHWFDVDAAFREFRRILKPRGWVAIVACGRAQDGREENRAYRSFLENCSGRAASLEPLLGVYEQLGTLFAGGQFFHAEVTGEMNLSWDELRGLTLSLSYAPLPGSVAFPAFEAELREYFDRFAQNGQITLSTRTWLNVGQFPR